MGIGQILVMVKFGQIQGESNMKPKGGDKYPDGRPFKPGSPRKKPRGGGKGPDRN